MTIIQRGMIYRIVYYCFNLFVIVYISSQSDVMLPWQAGQTILHVAALQCQLPTIQHCLTELQLTVDASVKDKVGRL